MISLDQCAAWALVALDRRRMLFVLVPRARALVLPARRRLRSSPSSWSSQRGVHGFRNARGRRALPGHPTQQRDWIDRAVGRGSERRRDLDECAAENCRSRAASRTRSLWENEFFNRSVGPVYALDDPLPGGLAERRAYFDRDDRPASRPDGRPIRAPYVLADGSVDPIGEHRRVATSEGVFLWKVDRRSRERTVVRGSTATLDRAATCATRAAACTAGALWRAVAERPAALSDGRRPWSRRPTGGKSTIGRVPRGRDDERCRAAALARRALHWQLRGRRRRRFPGRGDTAAARRPLRIAVRLPRREDRVRRLAAVARADRRQQLHPRLARRARRGRAARGHEVVAFAPTSPRRDARRSPRRSTGIPSSCGFAAAGRARAGARRGRASAGRRPSGGSARFDVLHFTDWMYPPQRAGLRATTIHDLVPRALPGVGAPAGRARCTARKYANAARTCDVIVRQLGVHRRRRRASCSASRASGSSSRTPASAPSSRPTARRPTSARPYLLTVATLEPRKNLGTLVDAHRAARGDELALAVVGGAGWGPQPRARPARASSGSAASTDDELARLYRGAAAFVYPSRFEGFGMPIARGDGVGAPVVASAHPSLDEACGDAAVRADPESAGGDRRDAIREALGAPRRAARRRGSRTRARSRGARDRRGSSSTGYAAILRSGSTRRRSARRAPARRATCAGCSPHLDGWSTSRGSLPATSPAARRCRADAALVPVGSATGARLDVLHCPTLPRAVPVAGAARRHRARPRRAAPPGVVQPLDAHLLARRRAARRARRDARDRRLGVHAARAGRAARRPGGADPRRAERGRATRSRRTAPRAEGDYVLAVGTLEPRKNLRAASPAARSSGELRVVGARGLGRRRAAGERRRWLGDVGDEELARALPRRALPRLRVALRGLRDPGRRGARVRLPGRDERGQRDGGGRRRRRPCSSIRRPDAIAEGRSARAIARASELGRAGRRRAARSRGARGAERPRPSTRSSRDRSSSSTPTCSGGARTGDETYVTNLLRELPAAAPRPALRRGDAAPRARARRRRADRAAGALPGAAHGVVAAAPAAAARGRRSRTSSTRCRCGCRPAPSSRCTTSRSSATRALMGRSTALVFRTVVPRSARARRHVLAVSERTKRDLVELYGIAAGEDRRDAERRRPGASPPGDGATHDGYLLFVGAIQRAEGPARRARRGARGRAAARRRRAREGAGARARARARAAPTCAATSTSRSSPTSTAAPPRSCCRRATRASACPCSRRWRAARRSSPTTTPALREVGGDAAVYADERRARRRVRRALAERDARVRRRPRARARSSPGRRRRAARAAVYREVLAREASPRSSSRTATRASSSVAARARAAGRRARRGRERARQRRGRARRGARPRQRAPARLRREPQPRRRRDVGRARRASRTPTPCPSPARSRRSRAFMAAHPRCGVAGPRWSTPTARCSRRGAASRRSPARSSAARRCGGFATVPHAARALPPRRATRTEPVQADWMLGGFLLLRRDDARRARRLRRGLPPLRRGHRPLLPRARRPAGSAGTCRRAVVRHEHQAETDRAG